MQDVRNHRLWWPSATPIVSSMKNTSYRYSTVEELRALETGARGARAREVARLFRTGARALKSLAERLVSTPGGRRIGHA
jgi:hypothetical protein